MSTRKYELAMQNLAAATDLVFTLTEQVELLHVENSNLKRIMEEMRESDTENTTEDVDD